VTRTNTELEAELEALRNEYKEFAYVVSHDFAGPLRQAEGFAKLLHQRYADAFDAKAKTHFDYLLQATERGQALLEVMLKYARLDAPQRDVEPVDLNLIWQECCKRLQSLITERDARLTCDTLPVLRASRMHMHTLFYHLLKNALQYHEEGCKADIALTYLALPGGGHRFEILDNGIGFNPEYAERLMIILTRGVDPSAYPGMGAGLAYIRKIARIYQGELTLEFTPTKGTTACVTLYPTTV
tara:strand:- start:882 stop:1607 length:726 start_codon:yes stop_codon:yes gene_type:complete